MAEEEKDAILLCHSVHTSGSGELSKIRNCDRCGIAIWFSEIACEQSSGLDKSDVPIRDVYLVCESCGKEMMKDVAPGSTIEVAFPDEDQLAALGDMGVTQDEIRNKMAEFREELGEDGLDVDFKFRIDPPSDTEKDKEPTDEE